VTGLTLIGAGFGRTGTLSLKLALEQLGLGRCYHMMEVMGNPGHAAQWHAAAKGEHVDWDALLDGYAAAVDWPACSFWRELTKQYPHAKVLLSLRDPERWYESVSNTIYHAMTREMPAGLPDDLYTQLEMSRDLILQRTFDGRFEDRDHAIAVYNRHNEAVKAEVPADRLLVFEAAQGWEPLCTFLDRPVPDSEFPRVNSSDEFRARMGLQPS